MVIAILSKTCSVTSGKCLFLLHFLRLSFLFFFFNKMKVALTSTYVTMQGVYLKNKC